MRLPDWGYSAAWQAVRAVPGPVARTAFDLGARLDFHRHSTAVRRLRGNLSRVVDASVLEATVEAGMRSYARYWCEVFRLPELDRDTVVGRMTVAYEHRLREAWAEGRGMILALPHTGNWDHAGAWLVMTGVPFTTVAERLRPEALYHRFLQFRESLGMEVIPLTGGERPPYAVLAERLRAGGCLCLLADRDLTSTGVEVDFFGGRAKMPAGPAALAIDTGAALLPVTLHYPDDRSWAGHIHPRVEPPSQGSRQQQIAAMTQQVADAFGAGIAAYPQDWHMFQKVWI